MESHLGADASPLALPSLRLLVPPLQLMTAVMLRALHRLEVPQYWRVARFVSVVMDMVPELLLDPHWTQLCTGLRAKYILELCRCEKPADPEQLTALLDEVTRPRPPSAGQEEEKEVEEEVEKEVEANFVELVHTMLKDPEVKQNFFTEVYPVAYGPDYDRDLLTLFQELLCRLAQLLPIPDLGQTVSWLGRGGSLLDECDGAVSSAHLRGLLGHHRQLAHLEQHVPPSSMGDCILSALAGPPPAGPPSQSASPLSPGDHAPHGAAVAEVMVTDYAEVELGTTAPSQEEEEEEEEEEYVKDVVMEKEEEGPPEEDPGSPDDMKQEQETAAASPARRHGCPDCQKRFRFASSLTAHQVVHTGERPHRCSACSRRFSFRQSLDRHKHTHEAAAPGRAGVRAASGPHACTLCDKKFTWESALARHLETHSEEPLPKEEQEEQEVGGAEDGVAESGVLAPALVEQVVSMVTVRTSGRKRKPTMKVQVINLQKRLGRGGAAAAAAAAGAEPKRKKQSRATVPFNSSEHSYGSSEVQTGSAEGAAEGGSSRVLGGADNDLQVLQAPPPPPPVAGPDDDDDSDAAPAVVLQDGRFGCPDCGKSFRFRSLLASHRRVHTGEQPFACAQCGRRFSFKQSLDRHRQTHRAGRHYECAACGELFPSLAVRRDHRNQVHRNQVRGADPGGAFPCSRCGRSFSAKSALVRHAKTHGAEEKEKETPPGASSAAHPHGGKEAQGEELHTCDCGKSFSYRAALTAHQRVHRGERPYACAQCPKRFLYRGGLQSHLKTHSEDKPFACSFCGKTFKRERNMKKHERCHTRENVFACSQCDKSFVYKATLTRHELTHSGQRPFLCSDCGKGFFSHAELLKHERFHTGHKPFQCPFCGKRFTQSCYLTIHVRYHTGARPYACGECDKSFLSANRLKRHQRTHTGEKPYVCSECGRGFRQSYHLKVHLRTHAYA